MKSILLSIALLSATFAPLHLAAGQTAPPNVIFFLVDDMGWTDVGYMGSTFYETPNIDRLASQGMRFNQAYSACTVCSPTRAAILTGQYPARLHNPEYRPDVPAPKSMKAKERAAAEIQRVLEES
jgi:arylsulfatase A-like enzyme